MKTIYFLKKQLFCIIIFILAISPAFATEHDNTKEKQSPYKLRFYSGIKSYSFSADMNVPDRAYTELKIDVNPIYLGFSIIEFECPLFTLHSQFETNFGKSGGQSSSGETAMKNLGIDSRYSYLFNLMAEVSNFEFSFTTVRFNFGKLSYYVTDDLNFNQRDVLYGTSSFVLEKNQFDLRYMVKNCFESKILDVSFYPGIRYLTYALPRILYSTIDVTESTDDGEIEYTDTIGESLPQKSITNFYLVGLGTSCTLNINKISILFDVQYFIGYAYTKYDINSLWYDESSYDRSYNPDDDRNSEISTIALVPSITTGISYQLYNDSVDVIIGFKYTWDRYKNIIHGEDDESEEDHNINGNESYHNLLFYAELIW